VEKALPNDTPISAVDLFCGCGGMTHGLLASGIKVEVGIDIDADLEYAYKTNNPEAAFLRCDLTKMHSGSIAKMFRAGKYRLLAGCAPCQPFSNLTHNWKKYQHHNLNLLDHFGNFVADIRPELVAMENVPGLACRGKTIFERFIATLRKCEYHVDWRIINCQEYGVPQTRRRLVLLASRLGVIKIPEGRFRHPGQWRTVRQTIGHLHPLMAGEEDPSDPIHVASRLSPLTLARIRATRHDGGTRRDWPDELFLNCHGKKLGNQYLTSYGRMWWDRPAPTMTTKISISEGRFGHPEQDRSITLREAALFQTFPILYQFWPPGQKLKHRAVSRMIGNAVPPTLAKEIGRTLMKHIEAFCGKDGGP